MMYFPLSLTPRSITARTINDLDAQLPCAIMLSEDINAVVSIPENVMIWAHQMQGKTGWAISFWTSTYVNRATHQYTRTVINLNRAQYTRLCQQADLQVSNSTAEYMASYEPDSKFL